MIISEDTLKNILIYIYDQDCQAPNDSLRDIINEALEHEEIALYLCDDGTFDDIK